MYINAPRFNNGPQGEATGDSYLQLKSLQKHLEFIATQEEYIKDEMKNLKRELLRAKGMLLLWSDRHASASLNMSK